MFLNHWWTLGKPPKPTGLLSVLVHFVVEDVGCMECCWLVFSAWAENSKSYWWEEVLSISLLIRKSSQPFSFIHAIVLGNQRGYAGQYDIPSWGVCRIVFLGYSQMSDKDARGALGEAWVLACCLGLVKAQVLLLTNPLGLLRSLSD